jgi:hypothetical protein
VTNIENLYIKIAIITYVSVSHKRINKQLKNYEVQWKNCGEETRGPVT